MPLHSNYNVNSHCDTELCGRSTGADDSITDLRSVIAEEMASEILNCSLDEFLHHYAPWSVYEDIVDKVYELYVKEGKPVSTLVKQVQGPDASSISVFSGFESEPREGGHESAVSQPLEAIVRDICTPMVQELVERTPLLQYCHCPDVTLVSEIKGTNSRIDACLRLANTGSDNEDSTDSSTNYIHLAVVAVITEFKKHVKDAVQVSVLCLKACNFPLSTHD
jgi:hypothetical protein